MEITHRSIIWIGMLLSLYTPLALSASPTQQLKELVESGQIGAAYSLAQEHVLNLEGDPAFDFYYGLAAIDTGHVSEGVFALERVLFVHPNHGRARLELARGYFLLGEDARARQEFSAVIATEPPPQVVANIERFLDVIRARESRYHASAKAYFELGLGHDTNVNSAPSDANFFSPFLGMQGTLDSASVKAHDLFQQFSLGGQVNQPVAPGVSLFARLDLQARDHQDREDYNTDAITFQGGISWLRKTHQTRLSMQKQRYFVGDSANRDLLGVNGEWTYILNPRTRVSSFLQAADLQNPGQSSRDGKLYSAGVGLTHAIATKFSPVISATLLGGAEMADSNDAKSIAERDFFGLRVGGQMQLSKQLSLNMGLFAQTGRYAAPITLFSARREDDFYSADTGLTWLLDKRWQIKASLNYSKNDSNIVINEYDRLSGQLKLRVEY